MEIVDNNFFQTFCLFYVYLVVIEALNKIQFVTSKKLKSSKGKEKLEIK